MKEVYWGYLIFVLGVLIIAIMSLTRDITNTTEQNTYLAKEVAGAAMIDSLDYSAYVATGDIRIIKEKFVEVFIRRFLEVAKDSSKNYKFEFYSMSEVPPIINVRISTKSGTISVVNNAGTNFDVINTISGTLESDFLCANGKSDCLKK